MSGFQDKPASTGLQTPGKTTRLFKPRVCGETYSRLPALCSRILRLLYCDPGHQEEFLLRPRSSEEDREGRTIFFKNYDFRPEWTLKEISFAQGRKGASQSRFRQ